MVRISKKEKRYMVSPRKRRAPAEKTGPKKDNLAKGFKEHGNALEGDVAKQAYIPKIN